MPSGLLNCAHCDGIAMYIAGRLQALIACEECGMSTPPIEIEAADPDTVFEQLRAIWNHRVEYRPADRQAISMLARRTLTPSDIPFFLGLLAETSTDWEINGPKFAAMASALAQPGHGLPHVAPPATVLIDAARYRKLLRRAKIIYIDGAPMIRFEPVPALAAEIAEEALADKAWPFSDVEEFVGNAIDSLPDGWQP
ncbi:hypothetical protein SAMN05216345_111122 [Cupriavidus sp. YR651]|uniref:hypothetical protein n=1 Tax=Cupriavidus sp. YR651 TaxID=1855315 RepID=UPI00088E43A6|nr:hypothetical protein [Cupriavidus sp. YR651]SDD57942.1 hypothetical protein SAMN05216345_111122 [Cupriavidus sp. YR651]